MRFPLQVALAAMLLSGIFGPQVAAAQDYEGEGYGAYEDAPPPRRGYRERGMAPPHRVASGLNCDAIRPGLFGPQPFSCPLPEPRPLGARCHCETPPAAFTEQRTVVGQTVP